MLVGTGRDLRRVRHRHHLDLAGEPRQTRADGVGYRAADPGVDLVEHQCWCRALVGQHHLQRQQEARQLAAGGDLHHGTCAGAGIGLHPELDAVDALRPGIFRVRLDLGHELRALQLERREFGADRPVELLGRLGARCGELGGGGAVFAVGGRSGGLQPLQLPGAGIDGRDIGDEFRGQRGQAIHRRRIFARRGAQREQPLLDALQLGGIEVGGDQGCGEVLVGLLQRVDGDVDRLHRGLDQRRRRSGAALQPAHRGGQRRYRRMVAGDGVLRLAQVGGDLLALHHAGATIRKLGLLAVLGLQLLQLVRGMAQIVGVAGSALHVGAVRLQRGIGSLAGLPQ